MNMPGKKFKSKTNQIRNTVERSTDSNNWSRTSLEIRTDLYKKIKYECIDNGMSMKEFFDNLLVKYFDNED